MATFYQVNFTKSNGDIEETELFYIEGGGIEEVLAVLLLELGLDDSEIDNFIGNFPIYYDEEKDQLEIDGEFYDDISRNGSWLYTDLMVKNTGIKDKRKLRIEVNTWTTIEELEKGTKIYPMTVNYITPIFTRKHYSDAVHELKKRFKNSFKNTEVE